MPNYYFVFNGYIAFGDRENYDEKEILNRLIKDPTALLVNSTKH